jgi:hypothetical protein
MSEHTSLVAVLEDVVLAMEAQGESGHDIHSMVEMILRGFIRQGQLTPEYIQLAHQAEEFRSRTVLADKNGRPLIG